MQSNGYAERSRTFLAQAEEELDKGDLIQASEKVWGAAAQMVKSVAQRRGWRHDSHRRLFDIVVRLARETGDDELRALFRSASSLHFNFYEGWNPPEFVEDGIRDVERLIAKLERVP